MRRRISRMTVAALALGLVAFLGLSLPASAQNQPSTQQQMDQAAEQAGQAADRTADEAGRAAQRAGERVGQTTTDRMGQAGQQAGQGLLPQGATPKEATGTDRIRDTLSSLTKDALTRGQFDDVADHFASSDRDRLKREGAGGTEELDRAIDQFRNQWKSKYNQDFDVREREAVFSDQFLSVTQGEIQDPAQLTNWPVNPMGGAGSMGAMPSGGAQPQGGERSEYAKGRDIAIATLAPAGNTPQFNVSLVHEVLGGWKIDIPDHVTASTLKTNLARHISQLSTSANQWPSDVNEASRVVTHHILMGVYGVSPGGQQQGGQYGSPQGGQSGQQGGQGSQGSPGSAY